LLYGKSSKSGREKKSIMKNKYVRVRKSKGVLNRRVMTSVLAAALLLTGCGASDAATSTENKVNTQNAENDAVDSEDVTEIQFAVAGTGRDEYWTQIIAEFEADNPNIKVNFESYDDFETKVNSLYASRLAPDVMYDYLKAQGNRVPLGQYEDISRYVDDWDEWDDFVDSAKDLGSFGGVQYGVPIFADARVLLYNKDLLEEAGLDGAPSTWDELLEYQELLTQKDADGNVTQVGFSIPSTGEQLANFYSIFAEENGLSNLVDEETNEILFDSEAGVEAAEYLKKLYDIGSITWNSEDATLDPFLTGKAAITITTTAAYKSAKEAGINVGIASPLTNTNQHTFCGMHFLYISSQSSEEKQDAAFQFIKYVESADRMWERYEELNFIPLRKSLKDQYVAESPDENDAFFTSVENGTGSPRVSYCSILQSYLNEAFENIFLNDADVSDAFKNAAEQLQLEIDNL
jgi:ABC-type glycerol-3-phosphate transport system substrate-binding protein